MVMFSPIELVAMKFRAIDGTQEFRTAPAPPSRTSLMRELEELGNVGNESSLRGWKKKSILFTLPYWEHHILRHNLDVMHIEKNVADNILGTLLGQEGKSKDNYKARLDLEEMGLRSALHPKSRPGSNATYLPKASYQMNFREKDAFLKVLKEIKAPDEFSSNIAGCIQLQQRKLFGLKSYDSHILLQEFLPIAIRGSLPDNVSLVIVHLCNFFKEICSKVLDLTKLELLESRAAVILCEMERIFPPSFFTSMVHLIVHLATEARIAGPVMYRWMYPIERAHPEGSIAEGYIAEECLNFCSQYLSGVETKRSRPLRNDECTDLCFDVAASFWSNIGRPLGRKQRGFRVKKRKRVSRVTLDEQTLAQAHRYVLFNCDEITPFRKRHEDFIRSRYRPRRISEYDLQRVHARTFIDWFRNHVENLLAQGSEGVSNRVKWLTRGPSHIARQYTGFIINGFRFHTKGRARYLKSQNSGVVVSVKTNSFANTKDKHPIEGETNYYGVLTDIIQLSYHGMLKFVLFRCDWIDINRGCKMDKFGLTLVNFSNLIHKGEDLLDDPFILATQAKKVYYVSDERHKDWLVVKHVTLRDTFDMGSGSSGGHFSDQVLNHGQPSPWVRMDFDDGGVLVTPLMDEDCVGELEIDEFDGEGF